MEAKEEEDKEPVVGSVNAVCHIGDEHPNLPAICIDLEPDENQDVNSIRGCEPSPNFLHPHRGAEDRLSQTSSRNSNLSSALSFLSLASSHVSSKFDLESGRDMCNRSLGLTLAFVSGVLMTAYSSMIKILVDMDSMQVVVIRGLMQMILMGSIALYKGLSFRGAREPKVPLLLFLVSITGGLRLLFIFTSFSRLPLGDSTTIVFSSPVFVMLFSICILKERTPFRYFHANHML